jgi:hypothetical protein
MDKKVMFDLLDRGYDGNSILQILDALCVGMTEDNDESHRDETDETVIEELVETPKPTKKRSKKRELVKF